MAITEWRNTCPRGHWYIFSISGDVQTLRPVPRCNDGVSGTSSQQASRIRRQYQCYVKLELNTTFRREKQKCFQVGEQLAFQGTPASNWRSCCSAAMWVNFKHFILNDKRQTLEVGLYLSGVICLVYAKPWVQCPALEGKEKKNCEVYISCLFLQNKMSKASRGWEANSYPTFGRKVCGSCGCCLTFRKVLIPHKWDSSLELSEAAVTEPRDSQRSLFTLLEAKCAILLSQLGKEEHPPTHRLWLGPERLPSRVHGHKARGLLP